MVVQGKDRRRVIIDIAVDVFREIGFERASMALISRRVGGSKSTLYYYFQSKEELFEAAMKAAVQAPGEHIEALLDIECDDIRGVLKRYAAAYLNFVLGAEVLATIRVAILDASRSSMGPHLFEQGPQRAVAVLANFFKKQMDRGRLRDGSAISASFHFKGLIETGFLQEAAYGVKPRLVRKQAIEAAVDVFLRAYGKDRLD